MLLRPEWDLHVITLCRGSDLERRFNFHEAMVRLGVSTSSMGDLDDGPEQEPLSDGAVQGAIESQLVERYFDLVITHGLSGEYTRHRRHEEVSRAVVALWRSGRVTCQQLWMFAYADSGSGTCPTAVRDAHLVVQLPQDVLQAKRSIISSAYQFGLHSWEARCMPTREAFWCFDDLFSLDAWRAGQGAELTANVADDERMMG